jgi:hypothetical protein
MKRYFAVLLLFLIGFSCKEVETVQTVPAWLQEKIDYYNGSCVYYGTTATRYYWANKYIYEITIPISSCYMCDVYYANGDSVKWSDSIKVADYTKERTKKKVLWSFKDEDCLK